MKVVEYQQYGSAQQLVVGERDRPKPKASQVVVRVAYSSVNPIDWKLRQGTMRFLMPLSFPVIPGLDIAGEVVEVGSQVKKFAAGDWVYAQLDSWSGGASAEYAAVGEKALAAIPDGLPPREAAALPLAALTALQGLRDCGGLKPKDRVLIVGASGGVGHYAVQIAKAFGAHVTAVCSGANEAMARELGADEVIDYKKTPSIDTGAPYNVVLDLIVSSPFARFKEVLATDGTYVAALPTPGILARSLLMPLYSKQRVRFVTVKPRGDDLRELSRLHKEDKLRTVVDSVYPLEKLKEAHLRSETGRAKGKIVVEVCAECAP